MTRDLWKARPLALAASVAATALLAACGGGGSDSSDSGGGGGGGGGTGNPSALYVNSIVLPASAVKSVAAVALAPADVPVYQVTLPEWNDMKSVAPAMPGTPLQIGAPRNVADLTTATQTAQALAWKAQADGSQVASISITSGGAHGLRMGVVVDALPDAAQVRVYRPEHRDQASQTTGAQINALLAMNKASGESGAAAQTWWTPDVGAGEATLEIALPASVSPAAVQIAIPRVSHIFQEMALPTEEELAQQAKATSGSCNLDASCSSYDVERNAVAQMTFTGADGRGYYCSGTLLNNTKGDYTPYFMTAHHCISTQSSASSLQTKWFYRAASCNSNALMSNMTTRYSGGKLLYATTATDSSLLQLNEMPPVGATLAGWDARGGVQVGSNVYGLHHPNGDWMKYSEGGVKTFGTCTFNSSGGLGCSDGNTDSSFIRALWSRGVTEGGSSGSGLFYSGRLVGTLTGGNSQCGVSGGSDYYGRFDKVFNSKLKNWLAQ